MFLATVFALVCGWFAPEAAYDPRWWGWDGVVAVDASGDQYRPSIASSTSFVIAVWQDDRGATLPDLGWQIMTKEGDGVLSLSQTLWPRDGIQSEPVVLASHTGRCALVWKESSNGADWGVWFSGMNLDPVARLDPVQIAAPNGSCSNLQTAAVAGSDVVIVWEASGDDGNRDVWMSRVRGSGDVVGSVVACDHAALAGDASLVVNESLVFVVWTDWRSGSPAIYGQCWDALTNEPLWPENGMLLSPAAPWAQSARTFASDQGYLGLTYWTQAEGRAALEMQIVDYQQNFRFFPPLVISTSAFTGSQDAVSYLDDGMVIGWTEGDQLLAQARDFSGRVVWTTIVKSGAQSPRDVQLVEQSEGVDVVWSEEALERHARILYAQRLTDAGVPQWQAGGVRVCRTDGGQENANAISAFDGSLGVAWEDHRDPRTVRVAMQRMN